MEILFLEPYPCFQLPSSSCFGAESVVWRSSWVVSHLPSTIHIIQTGLQTKWVPDSCVGQNQLFQQRYIQRIQPNRNGLSILGVFVRIKLLMASANSPAALFVFAGPVLVRFKGTPKSKNPPTYFLSMPDPQKIRFIRAGYVQQTHRPTC